MPFVLDASVAACWFFPDEVHPVASRAWLVIHEDNGLVPAHWWFEIRNTMLMGERRGRSTELNSRSALDRLSRMTIQHMPIPSDTDVLVLARKHRLTFYDAVYLELAQRERLPLATLDNELANAARTEDIQLLGADWPR